MVLDRELVAPGLAGAAGLIDEAAVTGGFGPAGEVGDHGVRVGQPVPGCSNRRSPV